jgi:hypothetical protein
MKMIDEVVAEVRKNRELLYAELGQDLHRFLEEMRRREREHPERLINKEQLDVLRGTSVAKSA